MFGQFFKSSKKNKTVQEPMAPIRVVIMGRDENVAVDIKNVLKESFRQMPIFLSITEDDFIFEDFLASDNKNFFDFYDSGMKALKKHQADVLLRFYQKGGNVRLHFLTQNMYLTSEVPFFSALFGLYLPVSYFQEQNLPVQIANLLGSTCVALSLKKDVRYRKILADFVNALSKNKMPQGIEKKFMPHVFGFLAYNYLALHEKTFSKKDFKLVLNLIGSAQQSKSDMYDGMLEGMLLVLTGQTYESAANAKSADSELFLQRAIENMRKALKYFGKYVFPYDYAHLSLVIAKLCFLYFNFNEKRQALRDAVAYMRDAQKIFTFASFPYLWADIEGDLGCYLVRLGLYAENKEITELAIENYKNRQTVYQKEKFPLLWAETEKNIADAYYYLGKKLSNVAYFEKASDCYFNALEVFEESKDTVYSKMIENTLLKVNEKIISLNEK